MVSTVLRIIILSLLFLLIGACASTGGPSGGNYRDPSPHISKALKLCSGARISNAPPTGKNRTIKNFNPVVSVRGNRLFRAPVKGCLSSGFGKRKGGAGTLHKGIYLYTPKSISIVAASSGRVIFVGNKKGYGRVIYLEHKNGVTTRYGHLSKFDQAIKKGAKVKAGQILGKTGSTGNATATHLHYEILIKGRQINPIDL